MVPTRTGKPGKTAEHFSVRDFAKTGKVRETSGNFTQNTGKMRKKLYCKIEKNTGKVLEICQPVMMKNPANIGTYFKCRRTFKTCWKSQGNFQSEKVGTMHMRRHCSMIPANRY